ncbi:DNA (cytosine-5-)-methyltransferase [Ureaplasma ceti]|uniref:Cytosine-specific methyltransferase n=1 Tax=Ureaplasma ceti TaxID=3119530 RepID=A0ABP9UCK9_9BACT
MSERKVVELFAGVGGFRVGLNNVQIINNKVIEEDKFKFVFFNQWEPGSKVQNAYRCYADRFNEFSNPLNNTDISLVDESLIPNHDLLVGGFPCQDYSVARSLKDQNGIEGKKGVLWWEINRILKHKKPNFVFLENVDRLLISPSKQRGRDFSIMLKCFDELDYYVEWKVINAAAYGMPQKRKRIFIFACKKTTHFYKTNIKKYKNPLDVLGTSKSFFFDEFKYNIESEIERVELLEDIKTISDSKTTTYKDAGFMDSGIVYSTKTSPIYNGGQTLLKDVVLKDINLIKDLILTDKDKIEKIRYMKSSKRIERIKDGYTYYYSEGKMNFPDLLELPGRTMLTSEGTINRSTHVIGVENDKYRLLSPIECERLNMFPDNWTGNIGLSNKARYFLMGNALVCGIVNKVSSKLANLIDKENGK